VKSKRKIWTSLGGVLFVAVFVALALPLVTAKTNCGGNGYALSACATFAVAAYLTAQDNHSQFEVGKLERMSGKVS